MAKASRPHSATPPAQRRTARERSAAFRAAELRAERRRRIFVRGGLAVLIAAVIAGITIGVVVTRHHPAPATGTHDTASGVLPGPIGPEGVPLERGRLLAPASAAAQGATVDGIGCQPNEKVVYHIHTHLTVYVNGAMRPIPPGIGVVQPVAQQSARGPFYEASHCYYWLHVHAQDGIIHVEAPSTATYSLGQFFDIWHQPLSRTAIGPVHGSLTVFVDGKRYAGDPRTIPLKSHEDVQIDVGKPVVPPKRIDWSRAQL